MVGPGRRGRRPPRLRPSRLRWFDQGGEEGWLDQVGEEGGLRWLDQGGEEGGRLD